MRRKGPEKRQISLSLSRVGHACIDHVAADMGTTRSFAVEMLLRQEAERRGIPIVRGEFNGQARTAS